MILAVPDICVEAQLRRRHEREVAAQRAESRIVVEVHTLVVTARAGYEVGKAVAATAR